MANANIQETLAQCMGPAVFRVAWWNFLDPSKRSDFANDIVDVILEGILGTYDMDQSTMTDPRMKPVMKAVAKTAIESRMGNLATQFPAFGDETYEKFAKRVVVDRNKSDFNRVFAAQYDAFLSRIANLSPDLISSVKLINEEFIIWLKSNPKYTGIIHQDAFEQLVGEFLSEHGFSVEFTGRIKNKSADLLAIKAASGEKCLVECKRYSDSNKVGLAIVNAVIGASFRAKTSHAMLVTTSSFTKGATLAEAELEDFRLDLHDGRKVEEWLSGYQFKDHELWLPEGWQDQWT